MIFFTTGATPPIAGPTGLLACSVTYANSNPPGIFVSTTWDLFGQDDMDAKSKIYIKVSLPDHFELWLANTKQLLPNTAYAILYSTQL